LIGHNRNQTCSVLNEVALKDNKNVSIMGIPVFMKTLIAIILMTAVSLTTSKSQAQTVRDDSGENYFLSSVRSLCGPRAQVYLAPHSAQVVLSGEYLEDRNLDSIARNIALSGLNVFPNSKYFAVSIQDSQGSGYAEVRR
jgi:hypothetical protein